MSDLSSATLFYRLMDGLPRMTPELEASLLEDLQYARMSIVKALWETRQTRAELLAGLRAVAGGEPAAGELIDERYWTLENGILPRDRRSGLDAAIAELEACGPNRRTMAAVRLRWGRIEALAAARASGPGSLRDALDLHRSVLERIVEANLRLAVRFARRHCTMSALEEMDLVQAGCEGLMSAVRRFDPQRGYRFSTYSVWWIRHSISRALLDGGRLLRMPRDSIQKLSAMRRAEAELFERLGRPPARDELAGRLGMNVEDLETLIGIESAYVEMDAESGPCPDASSVQDRRPFPSPESEAQEEYRREAVHRALEVLNPRERTTIELRFGLGSEPPRSLAEIGRMLGVTSERVRQIEIGAFRKLRIRLLLEPGCAV
ncbi:sigma-70 family RNA polymerase sigma factor [Candidatus Fermentibacteria bacterium]|nr:sigma-70 family RNA polymerase sigma factor [Candidatus Fermentibacteria bacterium]